jgi:hypothetical protein
MVVKLWHFGYGIYHDDVMLDRDIIDLLRNTFDTWLEILLIS